MHLSKKKANTFSKCHEASVHHELLGGYSSSLECRIVDGVSYRTFNAQSIVKYCKHNTKEWTSLLMPQLLIMASSKNDWKRSLLNHLSWPDLTTVKGISGQIHNSSQVKVWFTVVTHIMIEEDLRKNEVELTGKNFADSLQWVKLAKLYSDVLQAFKKLW